MRLDAEPCHNLGCLLLSEVGKNSVTNKKLAIQARSLVDKVIMGLVSFQTSVILHLITSPLRHIFMQSCSIDIIVRILSN